MHAHTQEQCAWSLRLNPDAVTTNFGVSGSSLLEIGLLICWPPQAHWVSGMTCLSFCRQPLWAACLWPAVAEFPPATPRSTKCAMRADNDGDLPGVMNFYFLAYYLFIFYTASWSPRERQFQGNSSTHPSIHLFIRPSSIHLSILPSIYPSTHPPVHRFKEHLQRVRCYPKWLLPQEAQNIERTKGKWVANHQSRIFSFITWSLNRCNPYAGQRGNVNAAALTPLT